MSTVTLRMPITPPLRTLTMSLGPSPAWLCLFSHPTAPLADPGPGTEHSAMVGHQREEDVWCLAKGRHRNRCAMIPPRAFPLVPGQLLSHGALPFWDWELLLDRAFNLEMKRFSENTTPITKGQASLQNLFVIMKLNTMNLFYPPKSVKSNSKIQSKGKEKKKKSYFDKKKIRKKI